MDLQNATLLALVVFVLVEVAKQVVPDSIQAVKGFTILSALVLGVAAAFLVAETAWGKDQIVNGHSLADINAASKAVVGLLAGAGAVGIHKVLSAVSNVGENQPE